MDLAHGALNKAHKLNQQRIDFLHQIGTGNRYREPLQILVDLTAKKHKLESMNEHGRELMVKFSCLKGELLQTNYKMVCETLQNSCPSNKSC